MRVHVLLLVSICVLVPPATIQAGQQAPKATPSAGPAAAAKPSNAATTSDVDRIIELVKTGMSENLVIKTIQSSGNVYKLAPVDVLRLKKAGVGDAVIEAMVDTAVQAKPELAVSPAPSKPVPAKAGPAESRSPGDREPTEADMAAALKAGADAGNAQLKEIEEKCRSGAWRNGNDQALAILCLAGAVGTGGAGGLRNDITGFRKVACSRAVSQPGWNCDYVVRVNVSGINAGPTIGGLMNTPTVQHGRFVYLDDRWVLIE